MEVGVPIPVPPAAAASDGSVIEEVGAQSPCNGNNASTKLVVHGAKSMAEVVALLLPLLGNSAKLEGGSACNGKRER